MSRRTPGRATRQILSGSQLAPSKESVGGTPQNGEPLSVTYWYLVSLAVLVIVSLLVWLFWGTGPASIILLLLAIGLIGSWLVL
jgi:Flp pilus assembly protein TadB